MSWIGLVADGIVAILLVVAVVYCIRLDVRLRALRSGQDGLKDLIAALDRATDRAQTGLEQLHDEGSNAARELKAERQNADAMLDELKLMVQSADRVADRLASQRSAAGANAGGNVKQLATQSNNLFSSLKQAR